MSERTRIPKVVAMPSPHELQRLPLTPVDGFVLTRLDGQTSEADIVTATGLPIEQVRQSLERLAGFGLVSLGDAPQRTTSGTMAVSPATPPAAPPPAAPAAPSPSGGDLSADEQAAIESLHGKLDSLDHYQLLGVARSAEKKEIKRAYYERAAQYHPDRFFRRNVGPLKPKLEAIFARVTRAHDVLTDKAQRAEYDTYLGDVAHTKELEARVQEGEEMVREARDEAEAPAAPPAPSRPPAADPIATPARPIPAIPAQARRDLLAKHLMGGRTPQGASQAPPPKPPSGPPERPDPEALKRHFEMKKHDVARGQAARHKLAGDQAASAGDMITAASSYKAALSFAPDDPELQRLHREAETASRTVLAETYRKQATYEEKAERWPDAAKSWRKLADLLPSDLEAQHRAGNALLRVGSNLHDAATYAQRAVVLEPQNASHRKLLAQIYLEAGLLKNARREIDAAEQLAPGDDSIAALARRLANATGR